LKYHSESKEYISFLKILCGYYGNDEELLYPLYDTIQRSIPHLYGSYTDKLNLVPLDIQGKEYKMFVSCDNLKPDPQEDIPFDANNRNKFIIEINTFWRANSSLPPLKVEFQLYEYLCKLQRGKLAQTEDRNQNLAFCSFISNLVKQTDFKEKVIILDNVGLFNKFGFPSARRKWKYHFEGKYKGDIIEGQTGLSVTDDDEMRSVFSLEEGDEKVELLHNSKEEIVNMENSEIITLDLSKEFEDYLVGKGRQLKTAKDYVRAISNEINDFVRDIINKQHTSLFHIEDYTKVEGILDSLKNDAGFCEYNKEKHNYMTAALGQYLRF
jgi:hypothetical protein